MAGALHRAAGPELEREARPLGPIAPGEAVVTSAHRLPNRWVIHCLGPVYGRDRPEETLLAPSLKTVRHVRFVLFDEPAWKAHVHVLAELVGGSP